MMVGFGNAFWAMRNVGDDKRIWKLRLYFLCLVLRYHNDRRRGLVPNLHKRAVGISHTRRRLQLLRTQMVAEPLERPLFNEASWRSQEA